MEPTQGNGPPSLVLTLGQFTLSRGSSCEKGEAILRGMDASEVTVPITTFGKYDRKFTVADLIDTYVAHKKEGISPELVSIVYEGLMLPLSQPLSTIHDKRQSNLDFTSCVFCWERFSLSPSKSITPLDQCIHCGEAPSYHCKLCCPRNKVGRHPANFDENGFHKVYRTPGYSAWL